MLAKRIAERLNAAIEAQGWHARRFLEEMKRTNVKGANPPSILSFRRGLVVPRLDFLMAASKVLDVREEWLVLNEGPALEDELAAPDPTNSQPRLRHTINERVKAFQRQGQPVISVDCKKKELVGDFANKGREYRPAGQPEKVRVHDFQDKELGKAIPYGVYDITENEGWVSVGTDHETAEFAVESIRRWWYRMGRKAYPRATQLLIVADGGGGNGSRVRLWKLELQRLANKLRVPISVSHFPPGTSKWNKIEHRMWSRVTENWRGRPLLSHEVIVNLIANTTTRTGLRIQSQLDKGTYPTKIEVTDKQMNQVKLEPDTFHGQDWNYTILPTKSKNR